MPVMYFFVSKFKLINVIILEWWGKNTVVQYTTDYLSLSTRSLLTGHSCFFPYTQSCQILCRSIYSNIMCQKIFNLTLKPFRFTLDHLKFCQYSFTPNLWAHATSCYRRRPWGALYYGERHLSVFQAFVHASSWTLNSHFSQKLRFQT